MIALHFALDPLIVTLLADAVPNETHASRWQSASVLTVVLGTLVYAFPALSVTLDTVAPLIDAAIRTTMQSPAVVGESGFVLDAFTVIDVAAAVRGALAACAMPGPKPPPLDCVVALATPEKPLAPFTESTVFHL